MSRDVMQEWHLSGKPLVINGKTLRTIENKFARGRPLCIQCGQATVYILTDDHGVRWILKKFRSVHRLTVDYLQRIASVLPAHPGFESGRHRELLTSGSLIAAPETAYNQELAAWLQDTILMPQVPGQDWSSAADGLRESKLTFSRDVRICLCRSLSRLVQLLEGNDAAHRDLSSGNVFVDIRSWTTLLIDFDSLYHSSFKMPEGTTCGTSGYIPPYAWRDGKADPSSSWCRNADRYALALLNTEFLTMGPQTPLFGDGGMFNQDELRARSGKSIDRARSALGSFLPGAVRLLDRAIKSSNYDDCPSPEQWTTALQTRAVPNPASMPIQQATLPHPTQDRPHAVIVSARVPRLFDVPQVTLPHPTQDRPHAVIVSARVPRLFDVPPFQRPHAVIVRVVQLPPDPWKNGH